MIGVYGPGKLGTALLERLKCYYYHPRKEVHVGTRISLDEILSCDIIFITVVPDKAKEVCQEIAENLKGRTPIFVSLMAGVPLSFLKKYLTNSVRGMIDIGITKMFVTSIIPIDIPQLFCQENDLNEITAIYACAPAFLMYFINSYSQLGDPNLIKEILKKALDGPNVISQIATKGGITEKGLTHLREIKPIISNTISQCTQSANEISESFNI